MLSFRRKLVTWCQNYIRLQVPKISPKPLVISNIYLRDNSQEDSCYNHKTQQRIHNTSSISLDVHPLDIKLNADRYVISSDFLQENFCNSFFTNQIYPPEIIVKIEKYNKLQKVKHFCMSFRIWHTKIHLLSYLFICDRSFIT